MEQKLREPVRSIDNPSNDVGKMWQDNKLLSKNQKFLEANPKMLTRAFDVSKCSSGLVASALVASG